MDLLRKIVCRCLGYGAFDDVDRTGPAGAIVATAPAVASYVMVFPASAGDHRER
jgi:hypothetical protein